MNFVDVVDLVARAAGPQRGVLPQLAYLLDSVVACPVDFDDVDILPDGDGLTDIARLAWIVSLAVAAVLIVAIAVSTVRYLREMPPVSLPETRVEINTPATGDPTSFALSPDGRQIAFLRYEPGGYAIRLVSPLGGSDRRLGDFLSPMGPLDAAAMQRGYVS